MQLKDGMEDLRRETIGSPARGHGSNCKLHWFITVSIELQTSRIGLWVNLQCVLQVLINLHNGRLVATSVTVVGGYIQESAACSEDDIKRKLFENIPEKMVTTFLSWDQL